MPRMGKKQKKNGRSSWMTVDASPITPFAAGASTTANKVSVLWWSSARFTTPNDPAARLNCPVPEKGSDVPSIKIMIHAYTLFMIFTPFYFSLPLFFLPCCRTLRIDRNSPRASRTILLHILDSSLSAPSWNCGLGISPFFTGFFCSHVLPHSKHLLPHYECIFPAK